MSARHFTSKKNLLITAVILGLNIIIFATSSQPIAALSGSGFKTGRIIDDAIFYNKNAMSVEDIQRFLTAKRPACDSQGTKMIYDNEYKDTVSRATYGGRIRLTGDRAGQPRGGNAPYTCLRDYHENTSTKQNNLGGNPVPAGAISAAHIIWNAAQSYNINPQTLIVMLEKEQALISDDWPWAIQYRSAMGYGCPDTAPCDSEYYGFYNQVDNAARQLRRYATYPYDYNFVPNEYNFISYQANRPDCGGSNILIENQATASLYNYTPYQPNQAALNNLDGLGNDCSAYGNRNFWKLFNNWFGSTIESSDVLDQANLQKRVKTIEYQGQIYAFYYDALQRVLRMATQNTTTGVWEFEVLDGSSTNGGNRIDSSVGSDVAVTVYGNSLQLFYYDRSNGNLRHGWKDTGGWHFENLDGDINSVSQTPSDAGINPTVTTHMGHLQLFYYEKSTGNLRHAWTSANGWHFENLDGDRGSIAGKDADTGLGATVTEYNNYIQLFYYDRSTGNLRHAWTSTNGWHFENLDGDRGSIAGKDADTGTSPTVIQYGNYLQLYYYDTTNTNLRHAWTSANGWHFENLDGDAGSISRQSSNTGLSPTLTVYNDYIQLFYYDQSSTNLRHAWTSANGWHFENLDGDAGSISRHTSDVGMNVGLTTYQGSLQLYYYDRAVGTLRHGWADTNGWHLENLGGLVIY